MLGQQRGGAEAAGAKAGQDEEAVILPRNRTGQGQEIWGDRANPSPTSKVVGIDTGGQFGTGLGELDPVAVVILPADRVADFTAIVRGAEDVAVPAGDQIAAPDRR